MLNGQPAVDLTGLTADEQFQAGLTCNGYTPSPTGTPIASARLRSIPPSWSIFPRRTLATPITTRRVFSTESFSTPRWARQHLPRHRYKLNLDFTAINLTNKYALYTSSRRSAERIM